MDSPEGQSSRSRGHPETSRGLVSYSRAFLYNVVFICRPNCFQSA